MPSLRTYPSIGPGIVAILGMCAALNGCDKPDIVGKKPERIIGDHGLGPGQFHHPRAVACAPDGCVFVIDMTARVQRFSPDGEYETSWQMPEKQNGKPTGITVTADGRVLIADTHYSRIMIYDQDGNELARFGTQGTGDGQFIYPTAAVIGSDGNYYVSEYGGNDRISRFSPNYDYLGSFGGPDSGEASLLRPQSLAADADNTLWVADAVHHRICRFGLDGRLLSTIGSPGREPGQLQFPYDLALCEDGTLLVCEFANNRLQRFDRQGECLGTWGGPGQNPGQLLDAWGVAIGPERKVYVVDSRNHRMQMFRM